MTDMTNDKYAPLWIKYKDKGTNCIKPAEYYYVLAHGEVYILKGNSNWECRNGSKVEAYAEIAPQKYWYYFDSVTPPVGEGIAIYDLVFNLCYTVNYTEGTSILKKWSYIPDAPCEIYTLEEIDEINNYFDMSGFQDFIGG